MLILDNKLINAPILSLQTGTEIARIESAIIDPGDLQIIAYKLTGRLLSDPEDSYVRTNEIREYSSSGLIVDSSDEIFSLEDIVAKKDIYEFRFSPIGLKVEDESGHKLGKVIGYALNVPAFSILQLRVARSGIARITDTEFLIHRTQIRSVDNSKIVVQSTAKKLKDVTPIINTGPIINPFRQQPGTQESSQSSMGSSDSTS